MSYCIKHESGTWHTKPEDCPMCQLEAENAKLRGLMSEALSNMEYYQASLGEHGLVQDSDITAMQEALQEKGE